jgi:hypothetical protein
MRLKRLITLTLVFMLLGSITVFADEVYDWFRAKKVTVTINKTELKNPGLILDSRTDSKTMVPLRDIADSLQALVNWDQYTQTIHIYKPNIHLFVIQVIDEKPGKTFGKVSKGGKYDFVISSQVDNLLTDVDSLKVTVIDPYGKEIESHIKSLRDIKDTFWYTTPTISHEFKYSGKYTVKYYLKSSSASDYALVSEKVIYSTSE